MQPVANESGLKGALLYLQKQRGKPRLRQATPLDPVASPDGGPTSEPQALDPADRFPSFAGVSEADEEERARREDMERAYTPHGPLMPVGVVDEAPEDESGDDNADDEGCLARRLRGEEERRVQEIRREWTRRWGSLPPRRGGVNGPVMRGPGSKDKLGRWLRLFLPEDHKLYVEPYLGTGAVLLNKEPSEEEVVNDLNKEIVNLFDVLREQPDELARAVEFTPFSEAELQRAYDERGKPGLEPLERARRWLVRANQSYLRQTGEPSFSLSSAETARDSVKLWNGLSEHIREAGQRLKYVKVSCRDATELIWDRLYRREDAVLYVDPPYMPDTRAPGQYLYEMPVPEHVGMLEALLDHPGAVFLSGYDADLYHEALAGWVSWAIPGYSSTGYRQEILWMNDKADA